MWYFKQNKERVAVILNPAITHIIINLGTCVESGLAPIEYSFILQFSQYFRLFVALT